MKNRIKDLREAKGWSMQQLADRLEPATSRQQVDRYEQKDPREIPLSWIDRFARALDCRREDILVTAGGGFSQSEAAFVPEPELADTDLRLAGLLYPGGRADVMVVASPSLILRGYRPGDRILVDLNRAPREGDDVVVQHYDEERGTAETLLRVLRGEFLVPATPDDRFLPLRVGDNRVEIKAVIVGRYSPPAGRAAA